MINIQVRGVTLKNYYKIIRRFITLILLTFILSACVTTQTQYKSRQKESWVPLGELKFDDIVYFSANDELNNKNLSSNDVVKEFLYTYYNYAKEYEARILTSYNVDEYLKNMTQKIIDFNRNSNYKGKKYRLFTSMKVGKYIPKEKCFLMFNVFDNYNFYTIKNPMSCPHGIKSKDNQGRGIYSAVLKFQPFFKLPLSQKDATEAIKANFEIRENLQVPVMLEYEIENTGIIPGSRSRNGESYCIIKITKASVFGKANIDGYTKPINYLIPVDRSEFFE